MLPAGLQSIGGLAFAGCESITSFVLPESVSVIWDEAFEWNGHLKSVVVLNKNCFISDAPYLFGSSSSMTVVGYPGSTAEAYARKYGYAFKSVEELTFVDVDASSYYSAPAEWALGQNITTGTSPHIFNANMVCTRAQVVTFLWRANGCPEPEKTENPFADVKEGAYYYKAVLWAAEKGITTGTGETTFSPGSGCTRGQVVTFLWRAEGQPEPTNTENPFKDVADGQYYCKAVLWAAGKDITKGTSANQFSPDSICTRAQIVTFLYRGLGQQLSPSQAV